MIDAVKILVNFYFLYNLKNVTLQIFLYRLAVYKIIRILSFLMFCIQSSFELTYNEFNWINLWVVRCIKDDANVPFICESFNFICLVNCCIILEEESIKIFKETIFINLLILTNNELQLFSLIAPIIQCSWPNHMKIHQRRLYDSII